MNNPGAVAACTRCIVLDATAPGLTCIAGWLPPSEFVLDAVRLGVHGGGRHDTCRCVGACLASATDVYNTACTAFDGLGRARPCPRTQPESEATACSKKVPLQELGAPATLPVSLYLRLVL